MRLSVWGACEKGREEMVASSDVRAAETSEASGFRKPRNFGSLGELFDMLSLRTRL